LVLQVISTSLTAMAVGDREDVNVILTAAACELTINCLSTPVDQTNGTSFSMPVSPSALQQAALPSGQSDPRPRTLIHSSLPRYPQSRQSTSSSGMPGPPSHSSNPHARIKLTSPGAELATLGRGRSFVRFCDFCTDGGSADGIWCFQRRHRTKIYCGGNRDIHVSVAVAGFLQF
jgi:hypothetical protein